MAARTPEEIQKDIRSKLEKRIDKEARIAKFLGKKTISPGDSDIAWKQFLERQETNLGKDTKIKIKSVPIKPINTK